MSQYDMTGHHITGHQMTEHHMVGHRMAGRHVAAIVVYLAVHMTGFARSFPSAHQSPV